MAQLGPWALLLIGGILEMVWALGFKYVKEDGPWHLNAGILVALVGSLYFLNEAMKHLPAGTAYAVWTGIGMIGVAIIGIVFFKEPASLARVICLAMIVGGIIGLKLTSSA